MLFVRALSEALSIAAHPLAPRPLCAFADAVLFSGSSRRQCQVHIESCLKNFKKFSVTMFCRPATLSCFGRRPGTWLHLRCFFTDTPVTFFWTGTQGRSASNRLSAFASLQHAGLLPSQQFENVRMISVECLAHIDKVFSCTGKPEACDPHIRFCSAVFAFS